MENCSFARNYLRWNCKKSDQIIVLRVLNEVIPDHEAEAFEFEEFLFISKLSPSMGILLHSLVAEKTLITIEPLAQLITFFVQKSLKLFISTWKHP
jgi:hypothetical protein